MSIIEEFFQFIIIIGYTKIKKLPVHFYVFMLLLFSVVAFFGFVLFYFVFFSSVIVIPFSPTFLTLMLKDAISYQLRIMFQSLVKVYICKSKSSEEAFLFPNFVIIINKIKLRYQTEFRP